MKMRDYEWKADGKSISVGFIAQELYEVYPEAVSKGSEGALNAEEGKTWMVNYAGITPLLVKAIQDQQTMIDELKPGNKKLPNEAASSADLNTLKAEVESLKELYNKIKILEEDEQLKKEFSADAGE